MTDKGRLSRFVLTPAAEQDLTEIWDYIAADNPQAAGRVHDAFQKAFHRLAESPGHGHYREDVADKRHRFVNVYSYLIVYWWQSRPLQIIRVLHAARDVSAILDESNGTPGMP